MRQAGDSEDSAVSLAQRVQHLQDALLQARSAGAAAITERLQSSVTVMDIQARVRPGAAGAGLAGAAVMWLLWWLLWWLLSCGGCCLAASSGVLARVRSVVCVAPCLCGSGWLLACIACCCMAGW